jgi:hypothetical protein
VSEKQDDAQTKHAPTGSADQDGSPGKADGKDDGPVFAEQVNPTEQPRDDLAPGTSAPKVSASNVSAPDKPVSGQELSDEPGSHDQVPHDQVPQGQAADEPAVGQAVPAPQLRLRRAPRYLPFGSTGALIGVIAGIALALSFTAASNYTIQTIAGYFAAAFGLIGAVLGLGTAVLIERRRT